jgi:hypothetical protein
MVVVYRCLEKFEHQQFISVIEQKERYGSNGGQNRDYSGEGETDYKGSD